MPRKHPSLTRSSTRCTTRSDVTASSLSPQAKGRAGVGSLSAVTHKRKHPPNSLCPVRGQREELKQRCTATRPSLRGALRIPARGHPSGRGLLNVPRPCPAARHVRLAADPASAHHVHPWPSLRARIRDGSPVDPPHLPNEKRCRVVTAHRATAPASGRSRTNHMQSQQRRCNGSCIGRHHEQRKPMTGEGLTNMRGQVS